MEENKQREVAKELNPASVAQARIMAKRYGVELTEAQIEQYVKLRETDGHSSDEEVFKGVLLTKIS